MKEFLLNLSFGEWVLIYLIGILITYSFMKLFRNWMGDLNDMKDIRFSILVSIFSWVGFVIFVFMLINIFIFSYIEYLGDKLKMLLILIGIGVAFISCGPNYELLDKNESSFKSGDKNKVIKKPYNYKKRHKRKLKDHKL